MGKLTKQVQVDKLTQQAIQEAQLSTARKDQVGGKATIKLDEMGSVQMPNDWLIEMPLGDIIMAEFIDENEQGEVFRGGIWLKQEMGHKLWRVAKILKCGPGCSSYLKPGLLIMFPSDRGIPMINFYKQKLIFINEERIFAIVSEPNRNNT